jgi:hypothetical protein
MFSPFWRFNGQGGNIICPSIFLLRFVLREFFFLKYFSPLADRRQKEKFINRKSSGQPARKSKWLIGCHWYILVLACSLGTLLARRHARLTYVESESRIADIAQQYTSPQHPDFQRLQTDTPAILVMPRL